MADTIATVGGQAGFGSAFATVGGSTPGLSLFAYVDKPGAAGAAGAGYATVGGGAPYMPTSVTEALAGAGGGATNDVIRQAQELINQLSGQGSAGIGGNSTVIGGSLGAQMYSVPFGDSAFAAAGTTGSTFTGGAASATMGDDATVEDAELQAAEQAEQNLPANATPAQRKAAAERKAAAKKKQAAAKKKKQAAQQHQNQQAPAKKKKKQAVAQNKAAKKQAAKRK